MKILTKRHFHDAPGGHGSCGHHHSLSSLPVCDAFDTPQERQHDLKLLSLLLWINIFGMAVEVLGGILTNSLSLLSDAAHMFTHVFALLVAYFAIRLATRAPSAQMSFGYSRMEILAAFFNGITVFAMVFLIAVEAFQKILHHEGVAATEMLWVAVFGLVINVVCALLLVRSGRKDLNMRGVLVHLLTDTFSSVAIIAIGFGIRYTGWAWLDPAASLLIAAVIAYWGYGLLAASSKVLLQAVPAHIDPQQVTHAILAEGHVRKVSDMHIWELTSGQFIMSGHLEVENLSVSESQKILDRVNHILSEKFGISHTTFQFEVRHSA